MVKRYWKPLALILIIGVLGANLYFDYRADKQNQVADTSQAALDLPVGTAIGELAPDISGRTLEGETLTLSELSGNLVLVNVFASWCGPCRAEMPHLVEVSEELEDQGVQFVGLNLLENSSTVKAFRDEFDINFPLMLNEDGRLTEVYQPVGLPTSWFIDADGVVRYVFAGPMTREVLTGILEDIEAGREPDPFSSISG
jgi:thiol-disulfide isomerase/thioredoxin